MPWWWSMPMRTPARMWMWQYTPPREPPSRGCSPSTPAHTGVRGVGRGCKPRVWVALGLGLGPQGCLPTNHPCPPQHPVPRHRPGHPAPPGRLLPGHRSQHPAHSRAGTVLPGKAPTPCLHGPRDPTAGLHLSKDLNMLRSRVW